jgi:hypothetical protein
MAERALAVVDFQNGYAGLVDAMRARAQERRIALSSADFAAVSGLPSHYGNKLLAANPVRRIGAISLGPLLGALGLRLVVQEDPQAVQRFTSRLPVRNEQCVHGGTMMQWRISERAFRALQAKGRKSRWENMTPAQRSAWVARKLNKARREKAVAKAAEAAKKAAAKAAKRRAPAREAA